MRELELRTLHSRRAVNSPVRLADGSWHIMADACRLYPDFNQTRTWEIPDVPVAAGDEDLGSYLLRIGFSDEQLQYVSRMYANATGEALQFISAQTVVDEIRADVPTANDYRILDGYDHLTNALSAGIDIRLETVIEWIEWGGRGIRAGTVDGMVYEADYAVITLPLGVLQAGSVRFSPELPLTKQDAIRNLRMGPVIKMIYRFNEVILPESAMALYSALTPPMWWSASYGHGVEGYQIWTAFCSGQWARDLLNLGEVGALEKGIKALRQELNRPDLEPASVCFVNWPDDPFSRGGYSVTPPGCIDAREQLARSDTGRLLWAGEATAPLHQVATVHGAYVSGRRAAAEILQR